MKVASNKSKAKSDSKPDISSSEDMSKKPSFRVEQISNGFIIEKSWYDKDKGYCCTKTYSETNPLEK